GGERRAIESRFGDIVKADNGDIAAGDQPAVGQTKHDAECTYVVVAKHRSRIGRFAAQQDIDRTGAFLARRQAVDDRAFREAMAGKRLAIAGIAIACRRGAPSAADKGDALVAEADEMFGGKRDAEAKIGADMIALALADAAKDLHDRDSRLAEAIHELGIGALGGAEQQAVDPVLAHAGDKAILPGRRFRG